MATEQLAANLDAIDAWLAIHAPAAYRVLRPGLRNPALEALESSYGFQFDAELRILLAWHDGCELGDRGFDIWPDCLFENSSLMFEWSRGLHHGWDTHWVPIGTDLGLNALIVDHRMPSPPVSRYEGVSSDEPGPVSHSISHLISQVRAALNNQSDIEGRNPIVEDGYLLWE